MIGALRAPFAIINFASFVRELLLEFYINSESLRDFHRDLTRD